MTTLYVYKGEATVTAIDSNFYPFYAQDSQSAAEVRSASGCGYDEVDLTKVKPGDNIQVGSSKGVVQDVTWRHATIENRLGETVIIPNSVISKNAVVHLPPPERVSVPFVATTCKDLDAVAGEVERVAHDIALEHTGIVKEPSVLFTEITEGGLAGKVVLEVEDAAQATPVSDAITRAIAPLVRA